MNVALVICGLAFLLFALAVVVPTRRNRRIVRAVENNFLHHRKEIR
jgi:hypothetical protein